MTTTEAMQDELREWEEMHTELSRADTEDWEREHDRSKSDEMQWVATWMRIMKRKIKEMICNQRS